MDKTNLHTPSLTHSSNAGADTSILRVDVKTSRRLLVLMPANFDCTTITRRICEMSNATGSRVQLLGLSEGTEQEMALRRELVTMSALIRGGNVSVAITVETGTDWVDAVKHAYQPGDIIVCMAAQRTGILRRPLSQILESNLHAPIYILSELHLPIPQPLSSRLSQVIAWIGSLAIIAGFLILQVKLHQPANNWTTIMELLSTAVEFWLIWAWNSLFG